MRRSLPARLRSAPEELALKLIRDPAPEFRTVFVTRTEMKAEPHTRLHDFVHDLAGASIEALLTAHEVAGRNEHMVQALLMQRVLDRVCDGGRRARMP